MADATTTDPKMPSVEVRFAVLDTGQSELDEIVATDATIHMEKMSASEFYLGIDTSTESVKFTITAKGGKIDAVEYDREAALLSSSQPSAPGDLQATRIREFAEMIERADCAGSIAVSMWFSQASDMLRGVAEALTHAEQARQQAEADVTALHAERDRLKAEKENDAWHRGWKVAVSERDEARDLQRRAEAEAATVTQARDNWCARAAEYDATLTRLEAEAARLRAALQEMTDIGEMLWTVVANVSGGDWTQQSDEWRAAATRWRDRYFKTALASSVTVPAKDRL